MEQTVETPTVDPFDAAITSESNYVEKPASEPIEVDEPAAPAKPRAADGKFAKAEEPAEEAEKPAVDDKRPTNAEARKDPQARIRQQVWDQREAERRADAAERRAADAERREQERTRELAALKAPAKPAEPPKPDKFPTYAVYLESHPDAALEDYMDARDDWRDTRRDAKTRETTEAERAETTFRQKASTFGERFAEAAKADPDIEQRIDRELLSVRPYSSLTAQDKELIRNIPDPATRDLVAFRCFLADQWIDSEHAVQLLEHLSDAKQFQRLATLPPNHVIRELAKFEAGLGAAFRKDSGPAPRPSASQANAPIKPLGTSPHGAADEGSDDEPFEKFFQRENARDRKAGRL